MTGDQAAPAMAAPVGKAPAQASRDTLIAAGAIVVVLALQLPLVLNRGINWDEFWHYSLTVQAAQGTLDQPLQTFFTRLFAWVTALGGNAVDHIVLIRGFMLACELATIGAIVAIAGKFTNRANALLCGLAYISAGFVFQHGTSFRFDPQATALLMGSLWVLSCRRASLPWLGFSGVLAGLAVLITIKAVLYAPAFAGIIWWRWNEQGRNRAYIAGIGLMALAAAATFGILFGLHTQAVVDSAGRSAKDIAGASANKMFSLTHHPYWLANVKGALLAPVLAVMALATPVVLAKSRRPATERLALTGLWLPLTTLLFYHNTAPYFSVFMLAPVAVAVAAMMPLATARYGAPMVAVAFAGCAVATFVFEQPSTLDKQRQIVAAAQQIFRSPVSYFDDCAMIGPFAKANAFMTPWGTERYLRGETPSMTSALEGRAVPLVVANSEIFTEALTTNQRVGAFLDSDLAMMRETYLHFWGPFWVAGFDLAANQATRTINVRVPGPYTVNGTGAVSIDGHSHGAGDIVDLSRGLHTVSTATAPIRLVWGKQLQVPAYAPPETPYFQSF